MERTNVDLQRKSFSCSICLDLLKDPVTLPCGHSFCRSCVQGYWGRGLIGSNCQCPQCRRTFTPRPLLQKNVMLAELVEELKKTGLQAADLCYAGPEDVACDSCTGRKLKALKSCLVCLTSYCELHLQPHLEAPAFRRHKLVQPSKQLQEILCPQHDEEKKMFCRTDQKVICHLCAVDQHKDHHIVSAAAERREREKEVDQSRGRIQQRIQEREEELKLLQQEQKTIRDSADKAVKDSQESLQQMIQNLQRRMSDVEQQIRSRQETEAARVRGLQEPLEQEIAELKKKDAELQQLSLTDSHLVFLQNWSSPSEVSEDTLSSRTHVRPHCCFEEVTAAVSASRERLQDLLRDTCTNISLMLAPQTRAEFLRFSRDITLDPNTAGSWLLLSEGNRKVTDMGVGQSPPHPDRFIKYFQVLSKEPLTGRCYWEVERTKVIHVAVSYKNISRSGEESGFGFNDKSWSLYFDDTDCSFIHNSIVTEVSTAPPSRVGVYLDHSAGLLSFYSVSGTMTLLHRVHTTFTQPLHAGVWLGKKSSCEFLKSHILTLLFVDEAGGDSSWESHGNMESEMEKTNVDLQRESFSCSICLDLLKDPVTLNCGHSFCQVCVEGYWGSEGERNICQCPQCRRTFTPRPLLQKNIMLAELVEELKKTGLQAADLCYAGPEDVACDSCTGRKLKALKSCLVCLTSYCEQHLQPHLEAPAFRRHKLVQPSKQLQEILCPQHDKVKEIFCRTDQQVICHLCAVDQHKDHHIVSAAAERRERETEVDQSRGRIQQSIQEREEELKLLQQEQKTIRDSADKAVKDSQEILQQMIQDLQRRMSDVEQQIRSQQETEAAGVRELQEQLEQEITELKKKDAELQQLSLTDSHLVFLQNWSSPSEISEDTLSSRTHVRPHCCFEEVSAAVSASRERLQDLLRDTCTNISLMLVPQPKTRAELHRFSRDITLDPNTAGSWLLLSEGNRNVRNMGEDQSPHHPDRFIKYFQVLSKEPLTGRCYWEVVKTGIVIVAVSYKNISRSGEESRFGYNDKSWSLWCDDSGCSFRHNSISTKVSTARPSRVGVYLDHSAGLLSFYSVSETMTLLHRVHTTFTQPLHAGVWLGNKSTCEFLKLN
ncbi:uncharacterized protein LOC128755998 [Synchiropus splendidus]|uniref:uncharacterized protein LOC128755998 n=1 Tax=Synchiropus splendidus TaxID=270530 RepID=UPI00237DD7A2|nr:uncharacterized protein LOC128755998 [Synchiropus splendidus]